MIIGDVRTFPDVKADKAQVLKIGEECMEVFSAWELYTGMTLTEGEQSESAIRMAARAHLVDEIADVIQACSNLAAAVGVDDMRPAMAECEQRNRDRGRL